MGRRKEKSEDEQHIYIDTAIFYGYLDGEDEKHLESRRILEKIHRSMRSNPQVKLHIPPRALAETMEIILQQSPPRRRQLLENLADFYTRFNIEKTWLTPRTLEIAKTLVEVDDRVEPGDALILASAVEDCNAVKFITFDGVLLRSESLRKYIKSINHRLRITAEY